MATCDSTIVLDSEEVYEFTCTACSLDDVTRRALYQCLECDARYCATCMKDHNRLPNLRSHQILDESAMNENIAKKQSSPRSNQILDEVNVESTSNLPTERCQEHNGKLVDMFCVGHDQVCCSACIAVHHRSCDKVEYIPSIANGTENNKQLKETLANARAQKLELQGAFGTRKDNLASIEKEEQELISQVNSYKYKIIKKVEKLANVSKRNILKRHKEVKTVVIEEQTHVEESLQELDETIKRLESLSTAEDSQKCVVMKQSRKTMLRYRTLIEDTCSGSNGRNLELVLNQRVLDDLEKAYPFVESIGSKPVTLSNQRKTSVRQMSDKFDCNISDMVALDCGNFVISDYRNEKLKLLNGSLNVQSDVKLSGKPTSLCIISSAEIAVSMKESSKIQFVSTSPTMKLSSSFSTPQKCTGIYFDDKSDDLYVCCGGMWIDSNPGKVQIYSKGGEFKKTIDRDSLGSDLFKSPIRISLLSNGILLVTDRDKGVVALDKRGNEKWTFSDAGIQYPWGFCEISGGQILVVGNGSRNVYQINKAGDGIGEVFSSANLKAAPYCVLFDKINNQLVVGENNGELKIFSVEF